MWTWTFSPRDCSGAWISLESPLRRPPDYRLSSGSQQSRPSYTKLPGLPLHTLSLAPWTPVQVLASCCPCPRASPARLQTPIHPPKFSSQATAFAKPPFTTSSHRGDDLRPLCPSYSHTYLYHITHYRSPPAHQDPSFPRGLSSTRSRWSAHEYPADCANHTGYKAPAAPDDGGTAAGNPPAACQEASTAPPAPLAYYTYMWILQAVKQLLLLTNP